MKIIMYVSSLCGENINENINNIVEFSKKFNKENDINGFLITNKEDILQCIQGDIEIVDKLMDRIKQDNRHKRVNIIYEKVINKKIFTDWCFANKDDLGALLYCLGTSKNIINILYNFTNNLL